MKMRTAEAITLENLREKTREVVIAGIEYEPPLNREYPRFSEEEKEDFIEKRTDCIYHDHFDSNVHTLMLAEYLGISDEVRSITHNGDVQLPVVPSERIEMISDDSGKCWKIALFKVRDGLWLARLLPFGEIPTAKMMRYDCCRFYPSKETAIQSEALRFIYSFWGGTLEGVFPYMKEAVEKAKCLAYKWREEANRSERIGDTKP